MASQKDTTKDPTKQVKPEGLMDVEVWTLPVSAGRMPGEADRADLND